MKKISLFATGIFACALFSAHAQNTIFYTTHDDWTNFNMTGSGLTFQATNTFDYDGVTVDGIGNAIPGATSVGGALQVSPIVPCNWGTNGPVFAGPGPTTGVLQAMDGPGAGFGSPVAAQSGTMYVEYTMPDHTNGTSFSMGIFFQDDAQWGGWSASADTDLGPVTTPYGTREMHLATIPYTLNATTNLSYAQIGFWIFTDYVGQNPWYIDNISIVPLSTPPTLPPRHPVVRHLQRLRVVYLGWRRFGAGRRVECGWQHHQWLGQHHRPLMPSAPPDHCCSIGAVSNPAMAQ